MGYLHALSQDFISKKAIILLEAVNHFHIFQQQGMVKA